MYNSILRGLIIKITEKRKLVTKILRKVIFEVREELPFPDGEFDRLELITDLDFDSLDRIEMMLIAEVSFGINLEDEDDGFKRCITIGQVIDLLCEKVNFEVEGK